MNRGTRGELLVYTCIAGGYDELQPLAVPEAGVRYVCVTDSSFPDARGWEIHELPKSFRDPVLANRFAKMNPHLIFPEHDCSVYVDGNVLVRKGAREFAEQALRSHDIALYQHPFRDCVYTEAKQCAIHGHGGIWSFARQVRSYHDEGLPRPSGLFELQVMFRRHNAPAIAALMEAWWISFLHGVRRDQISLPYVLWRHGIGVNNLGLSNIRQHNPQFELRIGHASRSMLKRYFFTALNRLLLPDTWL